MPDNPAARALLPYVDLDAWRFPRAERWRGPDAREGERRVALVLLVLNEPGRSDGYVYLPSRTFAAVAGCTPMKVLELLEDLWKRQRVLERSPRSTAGRRAVGYRVTDPNYGDHWRTVPMRSPSSVSRSDPLIATQANLVSRSDPLNATPAGVVSRSDPLNATPEISSVAIWPPDRDTGILDPADSLYASKAFNYSSLGSSQSGKKGEEEESSYATATAEALAGDLRAARPSAYVNGALTAGLAALVAAGHDPTRIAAGIRAAPVALGPPLVVREWLPDYLGRPAAVEATLCALCRCVLPYKYCTRDGCPQRRRVAADDGRQVDA